MTQMTLQDLIDLEAIRQLRARYCLLLDALAWEDFETLFTPDCRFSVGSGDYEGAPAFVAALSKNLAGELHVHVAQMPILEITGPGKAKGFWSFNNRGALGHYQDEYVRGDDGAWRFSSMTMTWIVPPSEALLRERKGQFAAVADRGRQLAGRWGRRSAN